MIRLTALLSLTVLTLGTACANGAEANGRLAEPVSISFDSPLNLIVLDVWIKGQGPFRFGLDSGATSTVIDHGLANNLGLATGDGRTRQGTAAGSEVTVAPVTGGLDFGLARGFYVHVDRVITAPFTEAGRMMLGETMHGILGSAIFFRYVVEVDYVKRQVAFHEPDGYRQPEKGTVLNIEFPSRTPRIPFIRASLANGDRSLTDFPISIDSGGQTMGTASLPTRADWDRMVSPGDKVVAALGVTGLSNDAEGTTHDAFTTRMDRMKIGPYAFEDPLVMYSPGGAGFASLGASLLHRFTVVFDYSRRRLILEPNSRFDDPPLIDRSGVMLVASPERDGLEVMFVAGGTPGDEAGLLRGDAVLSVNQVPTKTMPLNEARAMFCREEVYRLGIERDGRRFDTVMKTRSLY